LLKENLPAKNKRNRFSASETRCALKDLQFKRRKKILSVRNQWEMKDLQFKSPLVIMR